MYILKKNVSICLFLLCSHLLLCQAWANEYETSSDVFPLSGHGELILRVPVIWNYNFTRTNKNQPLIITYYILNNNRNEIFQLNISVLWDDGFDRNITNIDTIKNYVQSIGDEILVHSDETELELHQITGTAGQGYYFDLSDSGSSNNEFKYLTQGALAINEQLLVFSLFTNDPDQIIRNITLNTIQTAVIENRNDVFLRHPLSVPITHSIII